MTSDCAICYVADINFLLPTLVSSTGLRAWVPAHKANVFIFLVDQAARVPELNRFLKPYDIQVVPMESHSYTAFDTEEFKRSHVSLATLGRFFMEGLLPDTYRRIVYIDGDTFFRNDPSRLIDAIVPEGKFAAVEDMLSFRTNPFTGRGRSTGAYLKRLGLEPHNYFNAGVFAASRVTWRKIASEAYKFFVENTSACEVHDQSALNAVVGDRRLRLSLRWNFQTPYRHLGIHKRLNPNIYHFTRSAKPWMGNCEPWVDVCKLYRDALAPFSTLNLPVKTMDANSLTAHNKATRRKFFLFKAPFIAQPFVKLIGITNYEKSVWL